MDDDDAFAGDEDEPDDLEADDGISDAPLVRLVNSIIFQAAEDGASDIHFEPQEDALARPLPHRRRAARSPSASRASSPSGVDHAPQGAREARHRRAPQAAGRPHLAQRRRRRPAARHPRRDPADGRGRVGRRCACSTSRSKAPTLEELGLVRRACATSSATIIAEADRRAARHRPDRLRQVDDALRGARRDQPARRSTSSPSRTRSSTGSPGINQVQINPRAGLTFATALRSILRSDPDVVMVGEIRDGETAKISIEAALTGPLRALDAAHERRPGRRHAPERDGRRAVPDRLRRLGRARPAARAEALPALLGAVQPDRARSSSRRASRPSGSDALRRDALLPQGRLRPLRQHRLQGPRSASSSCS